MDARGRVQKDLPMHHAPYIALWDMRAGKIITTPPMVGIMDFHYPYMQWYRHITQRFMTPPLHRDEMRFHTIAGTTKVLVSSSTVFLKCFSNLNQLPIVFIIVWLVLLDLYHGRHS